MGGGLSDLETKFKGLLICPPQHLGPRLFDPQVVSMGGRLRHPPRSSQWLGLGRCCLCRQLGQWELSFPEV